MSKELIKKSVALAIMRLQPLHDGHKILINEMIKRCDIVIIAIGSINKSCKEKNPYSFKERKKMLEDSFKKMDNFYIIGIEDIQARTKKSG